MDKKEAKKKYDELLKRYYDAESYFNNRNIPHEEKEKHLNDFIEILKGLNHLLGIIGTYTTKNMLEGFSVNLAGKGKKGKGG